MIEQTQKNGDAAEGIPVPAALAAERESILSEETIARLKESREATVVAERFAGYTSGRRWAERSAEWSELRHLAAEIERYPDADASAIVFDLYSNQLTNREIMEWLENELGERYSECEIAAFIQGAIAVFEAFEEHAGRQTFD